MNNSKIPVNSSNSQENVNPESPPYDYILFHHGFLRIEDLDLALSVNNFSIIAVTAIFSFYFILLFVICVIHAFISSRLDDCNAFSPVF